MLIRADQIQELVAFHADGGLMTSCYLNTDGSRLSEKDYVRALKDLLRGARETLAATPDLARDAVRSVEQDLEKIRDHVELRFERKGHKGLAIFSCAARDFWRVFPLPSPLPSRVVLDTNPYIRPLSAVLDELSRFCVVVVDRENARFFEVYMGEVEETSQLLDEVQAKVRYGGWRGYDEKRIWRHAEGQVHKHYKRVAERAAESFRRRGYDWLALGGQRSAVSDFERFLHADLQTRVAGHFELPLQATAQEVLAKVREIESRIEAQQEGALLERIVTEAQKGALAVFGVEPTLDALHRGAVHTLVLDARWQSQGHRCAGCGRLTVQEASCPSCGKKELQPVPHLVDEAIEEAILQGSQVEHVYSLGDELSKHGNLAAILRFRP